MEPARRDLLAAKFEALAERIKKAFPESKFITIENLEIRRLAEVTKRMPPSVPPEALRNNWMRIRANLFDDQAWFARSAADLKSPEFIASTRPATPAVAETIPVPEAMPVHEALSVGPPPDRTRAIEGLEGRWRVKSIYGDGKEKNDPEVSGSVWTFGWNELSMEGADRTRSLFRFLKVSDERGTALQLRSDASNSGPPANGWMIYEISQQELKMGFFDGLGERPEGFNLPAGSEPMFVVVVLVPIE